MKEKRLTVIMAGSVLVLLFVVSIFMPQGGGTERRDTELTPREIVDQREVIEESREALREFVRRGEDDPSVFIAEYSIIANAYARIGNLRGARSAYRDTLPHAVALDTIAGGARNEKAIFLALVKLEEEFGNYREARATLQEAIARFPDQFVFWEELIILEREHFGLAGEELEKKIRESIGATKRSTGSLVTYAMYLETVGRYEDALRYWREASAQNPQYEALYAQEISRVEGLLEGK
jgi:tetratricopeptide (TPR) repeat protein